MERSTPGGSVVGLAGSYLQAIVAALHGRQNSGHDLNWSTASATIEHILPDPLNDQWATVFSEEEHDRYVERLGNNALLEYRKNKGIGQQPFSDKAVVFETSQYGLTQELAASAEWTPSIINERQRRLARLATTVWRFP